MLSERTAAAFEGTPLADAIDFERSRMSGVLPGRHEWRVLIEVVLKVDVRAQEGRARPRARAFLVVVHGDAAWPDHCEVRVLEGRHPMPWPPGGKSGLVHHEEFGTDGLSVVEVVDEAVKRAAPKILTRASRPIPSTARSSVAGGDHTELPTTVEDIARVCHDANRAYGITLGGDNHPSWEEIPDAERRSAIRSVERVLTDPGLTPEAIHQGWMSDMSKPAGFMA